MRYGRAPMTESPRATRTRALAERLIAIPSVSPDAAAEAACAGAIREELPKGIESGEWLTADGRPVVWAHLPGRTRRTVTILTHYDTVGVGEFSALAHPDRERVAFQPAALRERMLALDSERLPVEVAADLEEERRAPGTWLFGRGALDMKSGIAAGIVALESLAENRRDLDGGVLFLACPDEENQSAGMLRAVPELAALGERLELCGALSLDYVESRTAYDGVMGKLLVGLYALGLPTHVGNPFGGADATQLAAAVVDRLTTAESLVEEQAGGVPPVALRMRDIKPRYDVQTALEAEVELNVMTFDRPLNDTLERLRAEAVGAFEAIAGRMSRLAKRAGHAPPPWGDGFARVMTYPELLARAGRAPGDDLLGEGAPPAGDPRAASWERVRRLAREAGLVGPALVIVLLPPYYPPSAPRPGGLGERIRWRLERAGVRLESFYRYITDASYLAWRADSSAELEALLPALGREYRLPIAESRGLNLDVVTLGPWGRDAHGLFERVHAGFAFETLPGLVADVAGGAVVDARTTIGRKP